MDNGSQDFQRQRYMIYDRAYYHNMVARVVQGAALIGLILGALAGAVIGWKSGDDRIGYVIFAVGGFLIGGALGRYLFGIFAHLVMQILLSNYRKAFKERYGEDI